MRKKRIFIGLALAGAVAAAAGLLFAPAPVTERGTGSERRVETARADSRFAALPARETLGKQAGEPFGSRSWVPAAPRRVAAAQPVVAPPPPAPPPMPYRVAGEIAHDGSAHAVLARGDRVLTVREGQMLEDGYLVESVRVDGVTLVYTALGAREHLAAAPTLRLTPVPSAVAAAPTTPAATAAAPISPAAAPAAAAGSAPRDSMPAARPARMRWEGPERVQAGNNFNVSLKLTSDQPVRASPMQLSFDAKLLEPVAVRPGGFFAKGSFTYRVNPGGSIFVGASGSAEVPADAEFLIVTFKPIRSGTTAELKLSSLVLQGAAGRTIVHEPPAAFRTAIVQ